MCGSRSVPRVVQPVPETTDPAVQEAIERERELARRRRGRRSTILTGPEQNRPGKTLLGE